MQTFAIDAFDKTQPVSHQTQRMTHNIVLNSGSVDEKRAEIKAYFNQTFDLYESLFDTLANDEAYYLRPCSLRHPLIFYFGHTATFFTNKLVLAKLFPERINPKIESMCAVGVDEMSWDDLNDAHYDWPSVQAVRDYRNQVREAVNQLIDSVEFSMPIDWHSPLWPVMMGIEHERIHLETSSVLIRQLPITSVIPSPLFPICPEQDTLPPENSLLSVSAGEVVIHHQDPAEFYGWDNEYGQHKAFVDEFKATKYLVSNAEFFAFVEAGGYATDEFWDEEGNRWRDYSPVKHPSFWLQKDAKWFLRCMTEEIPMPWSWPAEVNFHEAAAFCRWKSHVTGKPIRLPSEDEWLRLRDFSGAMGYQEQANWNLQKFASSTPIHHSPAGNEFFDILGNVWQWTMTPIYPFDGFKVHPLYDDFTTPTYDNRHNIFKGGSWISTGNEINGHSRYAFRRHFFQHAGFRYIESAAEVQTEFSTYETDASVAKACEFHYGNHYFGMSNFAKTIAELAIEAVQTDADLGKRNDLKVLDVGCSVGRTSFELAKHFNEVTGLDFTARNIRIAHQLQTTGSVLYTIPQEGEVMEFTERTLAELGLDKFTAKCEFLQQDASNMKPIFTGYDMLVSANLLEKLYEPQKFLTDIAHRLNAGGLLLLASTYDWNETATPKDKWLGGFKDEKTGENVSSFDAISQLLMADFEPIKAPFDLPFVMRETGRKFEHSISQVSLWKKRT